MNTHPLHFDAEYAKATEFGRCLVCSPLTVALLVGMSVSDVSQKAIANLGWNEIKLTHPLFAGDTLYARIEVLDKRESKIRPDAGIVTVSTHRPQPGRHGRLHVRAHDPGREARPQRRRPHQLLTGRTGRREVPT